MPPSAARLKAGRDTSVRWQPFIAIGCILVLIPAWFKSVAQAKPDPKAGPLYATIEQLQGSAKWRVFAAVVTHDHERLRALLSGGDSPNYFSSRFRLPITMACQLGDLEAVQILVRGGANVNLFDKQDQNALIAAAMNIENKRPEIMRYLLANQADPNLSSPSSGESAFFEALRIGDADLLSILIGAGADVNLPDKDGESPLLFVALRNNARLADFLKSRGARLVSPEEEFILAASRGDTAALQRILTKQDSVDVRPSAARRRKEAIVDRVFAEGVTPLMAAASKGYTAAVKLILANGANMEAADTAGNTALMRAIESGHSSTIFALLEGGANPTTVNMGGVSTLLEAANYGDDPRLVHYLLEHGVPANSGSQINETPLMAASCYGRIETVKILLKAQVLVDAQSNEGLTALSEAATCGSLEAVKLLLEAGADVSIKDGEGKTALDHATKQGHVDIVEVLKGLNSDVQTPANDPTK
jgi:ankyrin repeat protein